MLGREIGKINIQRKVEVSHLAEKTPVEIFSEQRCAEFSPVSFGAPAVASELKQSICTFAQSRCLIYSIFIDPRPFKTVFLVKKSFRQKYFLFIEKRAPVAMTNFCKCVHAPHFQSYRRRRGTCSLEIDVTQTPRHSKSAPLQWRKRVKKKSQRSRLNFPRSDHLYPSPYLSARTGWEIRCSPLSWVTCVRTLGPKSRKTQVCDVGRVRDKQRWVSEFFRGARRWKKSHGRYLWDASCATLLWRENLASVLPPGLFECETLDYWAQTTVT